MLSHLVVFGLGVGAALWGPALLRFAWSKLKARLDVAPPAA